jgi:phasin family protein
MFKIDNIAAANQAAIDQFSYFAELSFSNVEKFAELGISAARESLVQTTRQAQSLAGARDVHEVIAINSAALEPALKRAYAYSRTAFDAAAETNDEVKRVLEKRTAELNKATLAALEEAFKYAPAGSETIVSNVKSAIAAAQNAYDNVVAVNKQLYDTVEKTVEQTVANAQAATAKRSSKRSK